MGRKNGELESMFSVSTALPEHLLEAALSCASKGILGCTGVKTCDKPWKHGQNQEINFEKVKYILWEERKLRTETQEKQLWTQNHRGTFPSRSGEQIRLISWNRIEMPKLLFCFVNGELKRRKCSVMFCQDWRLNNYGSGKKSQNSRQEELTVL